MTLKKCAYCKGTGKAYKYLDLECVMCGGEGIVDKIKKGKHKHEPSITMAREYNCLDCMTRYATYFAMVG